MMHVTGPPGAKPRGKLWDRVGLRPKQLREQDIEMENVQCEQGWWADLSLHLQQAGPCSKGRFCLFLFWYWN